GMRFYRGRDVTGFTQTETGVDVELSDEQRLRAQYLVGCDGGRSVVRKTAGIDFAGWDATMSWLLAEVETRDEPAWGLRETEAGAHGIGKADGGQARIALPEPQLHVGTEPTLHDVSEALVVVYGTDFGIHDPIWISRFTDMSRQAVAYRNGR